MGGRTGHATYGVSQRGHRHRGGGHLRGAPVPRGHFCGGGKRAPPPRLRRGGPAEEGPLTTEAVFEAAAVGDPAAAAIIREAGEFLGQAAVAAVRLWDPERLVLGGGLFFDRSPLTDAVRQAVAGGGLPRVGRRMIRSVGAPAVRRKRGLRS